MSNVSICLFCQIANSTIPVKRLAENDDALAFPDINPQAPVHILVIPKKHIASHADAMPEDTALLGNLLAFAGQVAREQKLENGYRLVINTGPDSGQTVEHLHIHLLGGRHMTWPPG